MATYGKCTYRVSAKALIRADDKLLLVKEDSDYWDLPGGGVEHFENPEDALKREIQEEVGSEVLKIDNEYPQVWAIYDKRADRPLLFLVYSVKIKRTPESSPNPEIKIGFFDEKQIKTLPIEPHLEKYRKQMITCASRS